MSHHARRRIRPPYCQTNTLESCATNLATSQLFHPAWFDSFSTVLLQVVVGHLVVLSLILI